MKPPIETVRLTNSARDKLIQLKRITGMEHWNSLCRWGFCLAISAGLQPTGKEASSDRCNVEMSWSTFAGEWSEVLAGITLMGWKSIQDRAPGMTIADYFNAMLDLGVAMLHKNVTQADQANIESLVTLGIGES